jgi:hypothetical protein
MTKIRVAIHQPNYLPWLGFFRKIALCDVFVLFDNVQMPGGKSFVSRNAIKTAQGRTWLSVPVSGKGPGTQIADVPIAGSGWERKHLRTLELAYAGSVGLPLVSAEIEPILSAKHSNIADLNIALIVSLSGLLGLGDVQLVRATTLDLESQGAESIGEILSKTGATQYITGSGEGSRRHLDEAKLSDAGVETVFVDWVSPEYPQKHGAFETNLSAVDALLNCGPEGAGTLIADL